MKPSLPEHIKIAVIGLGYVGLPLAVAFGKKYPVIGFDRNRQRIQELQAGKDRTQEVEGVGLAGASTLKGNKERSRLIFSADQHDLQDCTIYIVTVPTPVNRFKQPDLTPLVEVSEMIGRFLACGNLVIYESTVYPGCTEEECVPVLERVSGLRFNQDFFVGYSPERINPGDKINTLTTIKKVTSGSTPATADRVDALYRSVINAGTHKAASIKIAEASKAIENAQRDINISFVNELALIFDRMNVDTNDVLDAAATKWNFVDYRPGLVGGHCIGIDPYYLAYKAQTLGYHPQVILSGRQVNDNMAAFIAAKVVKLMIGKGLKIKEATTLIMGITFKENCPDARNTRVVDIYHELTSFGLKVDIYDPRADPEAVRQEYGLTLLSDLSGTTRYEAVVVAVAHQEFLEMDYQKIKKADGILFDIKACLDRRIVDGRL